MLRVSNQFFGWVLRVALPLEDPLPKAVSTKSAVSAKRRTGDKDKED